MSIVQHSQLIMPIIQQRSSACVMFFADVETVIILRERADAVTAGVLSKEAFFLCSHQY